MIQKIIHFGLFGGWQLSDLDKRCIASWREILPDYELRLWTDENGPQTPWFQCAIRTRPINASNYIKWWALKEYGGWFLDNDYEVLRPLPGEHEAVIGWQREDKDEDAINSAIVGSEKGHWFVSECLERMETLSNGDDKWPVLFGCGNPTYILRQNGLTGLNVEQTVRGVKVYERKALYPWFYTEPPIARECIPALTFGIHYWNGSWMKKEGA